jgi:hypothetical protein
MVLDSIRTIVIWAFSIAIGWQSFHYLQVIGFTSLIFGMCIYNNLLPLRAIGLASTRVDDDSHEPIINREADEA